MKKALIPIVILIVIALLATLVSCSPAPLEVYGTELILIEPGNSATYTFADLGDPEAGWVERKNGDRYTFELKGSAVKIWSPVPLQSVEYLKDAMDTTGQPLEISLKNTFTGPVTDNGIFKIKY